LFDSIEWPVEESLSAGTGMQGLINNAEVAVTRQNF
jgi:hypothetical protein